MSQNSELFTLTYGVLVTQLLKELDTVEDVNTQLEKMSPFYSSVN